MSYQEILQPVYQTGAQCSSTAWIPSPAPTLQLALDICSKDPTCYAVLNKNGQLSTLKSQPDCQAPTSNPPVPLPDEVWTKDHSKATCAFSTWGTGDMSNCGDKLKVDNDVITYCNYVDPTNANCYCVNLDPAVAAVTPVCATQGLYMTDAANSLLSPYYVARNFLASWWWVILLVVIIAVILIYVIKKRNTDASTKTT